MHLGDHLTDAEELSFACQEPDFYYVPGNCDYAPTVPQSLTLEFDDVRVFMTHGHIYGVKRDLTASPAGAAEDCRRSSLRFLGHTHIRRIGGAQRASPLLNPGAARRFGRSGNAVVADHRTAPLPARAWKRIRSG